MEFAATGDGKLRLLFARVQKIYSDAAQIFAAVKTCVADIRAVVGKDVPIVVAITAASAGAEYVAPKFIEADPDRLFVLAEFGDGKRFGVSMTRATNAAQTAALWKAIDDGVLIMPPECALDDSRVFAVGLALRWAVKFCRGAERWKDFASSFPEATWKPIDDEGVKSLIDH